MTNIPRAGIKTLFFSPGLRYHQIQIIEQKILQRYGTQIRVNTWTGLYPQSKRCELNYNLGASARFNVIK